MHRVERADRAARGERHRVAHRPRRLREGLQRFVAREPPHLDAERRTRDDERPRRVGAVSGVLVEPCRGVVPVLRDLAVRAAGRRFARPHERRRRREGDEDQRREGDETVAFGMSERAAPLPRGHRAGQRNLREQVRDAERDRQPDEGFELVDVAQRRARAVEQHPDLLGDGRRHLAEVADRESRDADEEDEDEPAPARHPPHREPREPRRSDRAGHDDRGGLRDEDGAADALGRHERCPAARAAQDLGERGPLRRDGGGLDVVEEGRRERAEQQQRNDPPQRRERHERDPPQGEDPPRAVRPVHDPPQRRDEAGHRGGRGVDGTHQRDGECRPRREQAQRACVATVQGEHDGQQHPRREHHRQRLGRDRAERRHDPRRERERDAGDDAGRTAADAERFGEPDDAPEADEQQQRPPEPLRDPRGNPGEITEREEGAVREEVAVRLVLHLAERGLAAPQVRGAREEAERILGEVVFGVGGDQTRGLDEREDQRDDRAGSEPAPSQWSCRRRRIGRRAAPGRIGRASRVSGCRTQPGSAARSRRSRCDRCRGASSHRPQR
ncbi:hypothetical protein Rrhod_1929 [Rhodococcus rhodnii LMG 5362]|uniref:Uncharacterized protein n=1 Tax=Rhodococcus rhodnii LMG 5362 TaxID=1273125 RepID=R7WRX3_9NOCA|nr:hypothetical protein Rrhod_1929 [Rhodococcus rhodnii LMG 5362]